MFTTGLECLVNNALELNQLFGRLFTQRKGTKCPQFPSMVEFWVILTLKT
jgi:hypothetical protein